jgi:hypothetical protein
MLCSFIIGRFGINVEARVCLWLVRIMKEGLLELGYEWKIFGEK